MVFDCVFTSSWKWLCTKRISLGLVHLQRTLQWTVRSSLYSIRQEQSAERLVSQKERLWFRCFCLVLFDFLPSNFEAPTWSAQVCSILERLQAGRRRGADQLWEIRLFNSERRSWFHSLKTSYISFSAKPIVGSGYLDLVWILVWKIYFAVKLGKNGTPNSSNWACKTATE